MKPLLRDAIINIRKTKKKPEHSKRCFKKENDSFLNWIDGAEK